MPQGMIKIQKLAGIYYRPSKKRRHNGKPDRCFYYSYRDENKKFAWEKVGWASEGYSAKMTSELRGERLRDIRHGDQLPKKKKIIQDESEILFEDLWLNFFEYSKENKKSYKDDEYRYSKHLKKPFRTKQAANITPASLNKFKTKLLKTLSAQTTQHILGLIRKIYNQAASDGIYSLENPAAKIKMPSTNNTHRLRYLTEDEADKLLAELKSSSQTIYEISYISLYTGMRADEVFSLRWQDIDLENDVIHILETKNTESRTAYVTPGIKALLENKTQGKPGDLLFPQEFRRGKGKVVRPNVKKNQIGNTYRRVVSDLKFNEDVTDKRYKVVFHTLRHTFGSWLAIQGESLYTIKELMGHKRISQTMRYAHLCPDKKRQAVARLHQRSE